MSPNITSTHQNRTEAPDTPLDGAVADHVMVVVGEIDDSNDRRFSDLLVEAFDRDDIETVDLSGVRFFGCVGIDILVTFAKIFDGRIVTSTAIDRVLGLCRVRLARH